MQQAITSCYGLSAAIQGKLPTNMVASKLNLQSSNHTIIAIVLIMTAVGLGAFGAHGLADYVTSTRLDTWQTAVDYQMSQSLALLIISLIKPQHPSGWFNWSRRLLLSGILIFSGSLYALVLADMGILGAITPLGGAAMILAWLCLLVHFIRPNDSATDSD